MKLLILIITTLAIFCVMINAAFVFCNVTITTGNDHPGTYKLVKTGNDIEADCFASYFESVIYSKNYCSFEKPKYLQDRLADETHILLPTTCKDAYEPFQRVFQYFQEAGFKWIR